MMKVTIAAFLALQASASAFVMVPQSRQQPNMMMSTMMARKTGAAASFEEDLMLTLKVIMDHAERSTTATKDQYISQMEAAAKVEESEPVAVDISVPYDAAAKLAYAKAGSPGDYAAFKAKFEADAVASVIAKKKPAAAAPAPAAAAAAKPAAVAEAVDISVPYDAAAKLAYAAAGSKGDYAAFKAKFEADAVADVIAKKKPAAAAAPAPAKPAAAAVVDISVPYDAAAKLAFEKAGSKGDYAAFKEKFEADAVADVVAKQKKSTAVSA